jgi:PilZ domain-containing protein
MSNPKPPATTSTDWTHLLTDPDLVSHLGQLLQAYREAPPDKRDDALVAAMREIKGRASKDKTAGSSAAAHVPEPGPEPVPTTPMTAPPFEPDIFTPSWGQDRRRFPRLKCFVAVELSVEGTAAPVWGNLSNTSMGGCYVETVTPVHPGKKVEIGLWVANGKIWVKGIILNGTVTQSNPSFGVRVKFADMEPQERESLKQFLKFVETTTKGYRVQHGYLAQMKR